jgi:hypothetical protein
VAAPFPFGDDHLKVRRIVLAGELAAKRVSLIEDLLVEIGRAVGFSK